MRLTPASRHMSTCRPACATSVVPTFLNGPLPPKVIVPMVSTETRKPDCPSARYSMRRTLPSVVPDPPRQRPLSAFLVLPRHTGAMNLKAAWLCRWQRIDGHEESRRQNRSRVFASPHPSAAQLINLI